MSRIDELIEQLCPDGIPFRTIDSLVQVVPAPKKINRSDYLEQGTYPVIDQGTSLIAAKTNDSSAIVDVGACVLFGDHTRTIKFYTKPFAQGADGLKILVPHKNILPRYLFHAMKAASIPNRGYSRHWSMAKAVLIPIPPMEIQEEIVRILDSFSELEMELEMELEKRRKQYAYYRDHLLSHSNLEKLANGKVRIIALGSFGSFYSGLVGKTKTDFSNGNAPYIPYTNIYNNIAVDLTNLPSVKVSENEHQHEVRRGDALITGSSETPEDCGMTSVVIYEPIEKTYLNSFCFGWRPNAACMQNLEPGFLKYALRSSEARKQIVRSANGVTRFNISKKRFTNVKIPIPPIAVQKYVIDILDKFDALVNDPASGIPAEIEARRKQYEYYRDKLLTFKEKPGD